MSRILILLLFFLVACDPTLPTLTPTREPSAPTLAPSVTPHILSSDQLYGDVQFGHSDPTRAALPRNTDRLPPNLIGTPEPDGAQAVELFNSDGTALRAFLYPHPAGNRVPAVLMVGTSRADWGTFPLQLRDAGLVPLVLEIQENTIFSQVQTALFSLSEAETVDPAHLAVIGTERGADLALQACATEPLCDALALLSPLNRQTATDSAGLYRPRPMFIATSRNDAESFPASLGVIQMMPESEFRQFEEGRGVDFLQSEPQFDLQLIAWLIQQVGLTG